MPDAAPLPVEQSVLDDLRTRLPAYRRGTDTGAPGWSRGTDADYLTELS